MPKYEVLSKEITQQIGREKKNGADACKSYSGGVEETKKEI